MKITEVRIVLLEGVLEHQGEFWEERLIRPVDIYPEHREEGAHWLKKDEAGQILDASRTLLRLRPMKALAASVVRLTSMSRSSSPRN